MQHIKLGSATLASKLIRSQHILNCSNVGHQRYDKKIVFSIRWCFLRKAIISLGKCEYGQIINTFICHLHILRLAIYTLNLLYILCEIITNLELLCLHTCNSICHRRILQYIHSAILQIIRCCLIIFQTRSKSLHNQKSD